MITCAGIWIYVGLGLVLLELAVPGFILCFFGLSAVTVGVLRFIFGEAFQPMWQVASFSFFSVFYLVLLRRMLKTVFVGGKVATKTDFDQANVGRTGTVTEAVNPPVTGRVMIGDAAWTATAEHSLSVGTSVRVVAQENLTVKVEAL